MKAHRFLFVLFLAAGAFSAATLDGPRLGLLFDPQTHALQPILGIPGAAVVGRPLELGIELDTAAVSPMQDYVLATTGEQKTVVLLRIGGGPISPTAVPGADSAPDEIIMSGGGRAALLYHKAVRRLQVISTLPGSPKVAAELYLSAGESPSALAVSDDGRVVLAAVAGSLKMVTAGGEAPILTGLGKVSAIAFAARYSAPEVDTVRDQVHGSTSSQAGRNPLGYTALVADSAHNKLYRVRDVTGDAEAEVIGTSAQGIDSPVAIAVSRDYQRAFIANAKSGTVAILNLRGQADHSVVSCGCTPASLERLKGDAFRITSASSRPLWVLETEVQKPRVVFVPAALQAGRSDAK